MPQPDDKYYFDKKRKALLEEREMSDAVAEYLFQALPFVVRHNWGGDWREFREGVVRACQASGFRPTYEREGE